MRVVHFSLRVLTVAPILSDFCGLLTALFFLITARCLAQEAGCSLSRYFGVFSAPQQTNTHQKAERPLALRSNSRTKRSADLSAAHMLEGDRLAAVKNLEIATLTTKIETSRATSQLRGTASIPKAPTCRDPWPLDNPRVAAASPRRPDEQSVRTTDVQNDDDALELHKATRPNPSLMQVERCTVVFAQEGARGT